MATKWNDAFRNVGIHHKIVVLISMLLLVSFIIFAVVLSYVFHMYDDQIYKKTSEVLNMSSKSIENQLKEMEQLTFNVLSDEQLQQYLRQLEQDTSVYNKTVLRKKITNRLIAFAGSEKYVYSMMLIDNQNNVMAAGNREGVPEQLRPVLVDLAQRMNGSNAWYAAGSSSLLATRQIKSFKDSTFTLKRLGTLVVRIRIDRIVNDRVQDEDSGQLMITDGHQIIYPETALLSNAEIQSELRFQQPYRIDSYEQGSFFTAQVSSEYTGWTYLHATPFDQMFRKTKLIKQFVTAIFIIILLIGLTLGVRLSGSITMPIQQLIRNMRKIEHGNLDKLEEASLGAVPLSTHHEVNILHRTYTMMIRRIRELIDENYTKQLLVRETELKALQSQINPHFLYNTLMSVNWLAKVNKQHKISLMVESLATLLRNALTFQEQLIPLHKELDIVHSYLTIQKIRFEDRLVFRLDIEEGTELALIPKLTIQPLVENAIQYALEPNIGPCEIVIIVRQIDGIIDIRVEDNGPGMSAEFLEKLRTGQVTSGGQGIGLKNIKDRLELTFGAPWGIELISELLVGTTVHVSVPFVKGDKGDVQSAIGR